MGGERGAVDRLLLCTVPDERATLLRTLKLTVAYDGTRYAGWQVQGGGHGARRGARRTIQGSLEKALSRILQERVAVIGSGRTDAGVHALAQVAHIRTRSGIVPERLLRSANRLLPREIAVARIEEAHEGFHARFCATSKRYRYRLFTGRVVPPFVCAYVHHVSAPLNVARMRREAAALTGRHDVRAFVRAASASSMRRNGRRASTTRLIHEIEIKKRRDELHIEIEGSGFLHAMVRSIVGTLLDVARGRLPAGTIQRMLVTGDRRLAGATAPAQGLALVEVRYG